MILRTEPDEAAKLTFVTASEGADLQPADNTATLRVAPLPAFSISAPRRQARARLHVRVRAARETVTHVVATFAHARVSRAVVLPAGRWVTIKLRAPAAGRARVTVGHVSTRVTVR